jgi:hypothetical protein
MVDLVPQECDMTRDELLEHHMKLCSEARELMKAKNKDYAGNEGIEPFANFTRVESMGICKTEQGFMVRLTDKMSRLSSFIRAGKMHVADESFKDTCIDVINYMVLLSAYIADKDAEKKQEDTKETTLYIEPRLLNESPYLNNGCCKNKK